MRKHRRVRMDRKVRIVMIVLVAAAAFTGIWFGVQWWLEHKISKVLGKELAGLDTSCYVTDIGKVRVDLAHRSVSLRGVSIRTQHNQRIHRNGPVPVIDFYVESIAASGVSYSKGDDGQRRVKVHELDVISPTMQFEGIPGNSGKDKSADSVARKGKTNGVILDVGTLTISNGNLRAALWRDKEKSSYAVVGLDLSVSGIYLGGGGPDRFVSPEMTADDADAMLRETVENAGVSGVAMSLSSLDYVFKNGAMKMEADELSFDTRQETFAVGRLAMLPQYDREQYTLLVGDHTDWMRVVAEDVEGNGARFPFVAGEEMFLVDNVGVGKVTIEGYKNRNQLQTEKVKPTLYESVWAIPVGIDIQTITVDNIDVVYEEVSKGSATPGVLGFSDMRARVTGLTNRPKSPDQYYTIYSEGYIFGRALMKATLTMPAAEGNDHFTVNAWMGRMPATVASPATEPIANVKIVSGMMRYAQMSMEGNSREGRSVVNMVYDDLRISILDKKKPGHERELLTALANDVVLRHSNPVDGCERVGRGEARRDVHKAYWNFIWKIAFSGVIDILV